METATTTSTTTVDATGELRKVRTIPTYALLPQTPTMEGNQGILCTGWDAWTPRFIMTEKFQELLNYIEEGRKVRITVYKVYQVTSDILEHVTLAAKAAAARSKQKPTLYIYTYDDQVGNFHKERVI